MHHAVKSFIRKAKEDYFQSYHLIKIGRFIQNKLYFYIIKMIKIHRHRL